MKTIKVYVRGHGGGEKQILPPSDHCAIDMITIGEMGCTMSDEVADHIIYRHVGVKGIARLIENEDIIYWTVAERNIYYETGDLSFTNPPIDIITYGQINKNLILEGDDSIGDKCGVCYWDEQTSELKWLIKLEDRETIFLADILILLKRTLEEDTSIQLYWTACMKADYWSGTRKKVSFNPEK